jgi:CRISPR-associated protein Cas5t
MFIFSVEGTALTASFRVPETHTFHQTLPLPPPTTLIGLSGAALGLALPDVYRFVAEHGIRVGVYGTHRGRIKDLWNYRKLKNQDFSAEDVRTRMHYSVLIREYLFENEFVFYYGAETPAGLEQLGEAFRRPVYALTAGNSDDLLKVRRVSPVAKVEPEPLDRFENTVLPGDLSRAARPAVDFTKLPITETFRTPQVFQLPTGFTFAGEQRRADGRSPFTFISSPVVLARSLDGYAVDGRHVVLI